MDRAEQPLQGDVDERRGYVVEEAFDLLYRGKCNVCVAAKKAGVSPEEMKRLFRGYVAERPINVNDPDVWLGDVELGWPWV
tara:strand:+ start:132 stop:374 length:243 start_codon:yes stop_codon:yes gene_type:complete